MVSGANEHQFATLLQFQSQISTHFPADCLAV